MIRFLNVLEMGTDEPENFVYFFCAVVYDLLWGILWADEDTPAQNVV
jgi:hypothetical protein